MDPADRQAIHDLIADYCYSFDAADHDACAELSESLIGSASPCPRH